MQLIDLPTVPGTAKWPEAFKLVQSLDERMRLPTLAVDGRLQTLWGEKAARHTELASVCFEAAKQFASHKPATHKPASHSAGTGGWLLLDLQARITPIQLPADGSLDQWQTAVGSFFAELGKENISQAPLLIAATPVAAPGQPLLWGDACNCDPISGSPLALTVRALSGLPDRRRILGRARAEYYYHRASLDRGEELLLGSEGRHLLDRQSAGQLAKTVSDLQSSAGIQLFWLQTGGSCLIWGASSSSLPDPAAKKGKHAIYRMQQQGEVLATGIAIGRGIVSGRICSDNASPLTDDSILVVDTLDPAWVSSLGEVGGIVARRGGRTSHAALIAAEHGIPTLVSCPLPPLDDGTEITLDCGQANKGQVFAGSVPFRKQEVDLQAPSSLPVDVMLDVANPYRAYQQMQEPNCGIGLARLEFIVNRMIGIHPRAIFEPARLAETERRLLAEKTEGYSSAEEMYVEKLCQGIATLAVAAEGNPVHLRLSDFKSDEYARLPGGSIFEPKESNPMLGLRGASRYLQHEFQPCLELECRAVKRVREAMGMRQIALLIPFIRTPEEAQAALDLLAGWGLKRGEAGLKIYMMCEVPSNLILAEQFARLFDGFSVGTSDLTQLILGVDRNSPMVAHLFDEGQDAVLHALEPVIASWRDSGHYIGICGRGISDNLPLALWFARQQVDSLTASPGRAADMWLILHEKLQEAT